MNNSGYITIDINGQTVGLKFGLPAIKQFSSFAAKVPFYDAAADGSQTYSDLGLAHILFAGYANNQYIKAEDVVLKYEAFYEYVMDAVEQNTVATSIKPVIECFEGSKYVEPFVSTDKSKKKSGPGKK